LRLRAGDDAEADAIGTVAWMAGFAGEAARIRGVKVPRAAADDDLAFADL